MRAIDKALAVDAFKALMRRTASLRDDDQDHIALAHRKEHVTEVSEVAEHVASGHKYLDADTVVSPGTWEAALRAVGAGLDAVDIVMAGDAANAFCQVRPPGHHAESNRAMGFCLFNNVAIAAHYARARYGAERIAVVDFDVHHGNGTQEIFWSDKNLFYGSTHQMPLFPARALCAKPASATFSMRRCARATGASASTRPFAAVFFRRSTILRLICCSFRRASMPIIAIPSANSNSSKRTFIGRPNP